MARPAALSSVPEVDDSHRTRQAGPPPETAAELQAAVEGVPFGDQVEFMGQKFRIADKIGLIPLTRYAQSARRGATAMDMEGLASIGDMLEDCFVIARACGECEKCQEGGVCPAEDLGDWPRFAALATARKADGEDLLPVITQVIELMTSRPTRRPSGSSAGPQTISPSSTASSSSPDVPTGQVTEKLYTVDDLVKRAGG